MEQELMDCDKYPESNEPETSKLQLMDLRDDVIEKILEHLSIEELANCADTNKRLNGIAQSFYSRKHGNRSVWIGDITYRWIQIYKPIEINDVDASCFKLIRNFGKFIRTIQLEGTLDLYQGRPIGFRFKDCYEKILESVEDPSLCRKFKKLIEYIFEYCADSLEDIALIECPFFELNKPQKKLHTFVILDKYGYKDYSESVKWMTNLRCFKMLIGNKPEIFPKVLKTCIPTLKEVQLKLCSRIDMLSFISFLQINPQLEKLFVAIKSEYNGKSAIIPSIAQYSQIKQLTLVNIGDPLDQVPSCRFKTIEECSIDFSVLSQVKNLVFDELKELNFQHSLCKFESDFMTFVSRQKKLKKITFYAIYSIEENNFHRLQNELSELEEIVFYCHTGGENACISQSILKRGSSNDWIMTETIADATNDFFYPNVLFNERTAILKFQRNKNNA